MAHGEAMRDDVRISANARAQDSLTQKSDRPRDGKPLLDSCIQKRSIVLHGHKTSISLEDIFWDALKGIAMDRRQSISDLLESVDAARDNANLSSALRVFVFEHYHDKALAA